jgi:hypothetical protein
MKHRLQLRAKHVPMPPPDPSTRVEVDFAAGAALSTKATRRKGDLIVAAGLGGILVSVCSAFVDLLDLPSLSERSVAGLGALLVLVGVLTRRRVEPMVVMTDPTDTASPMTPDDVPEERPLSVDLPSLTGQISGVLAQLRQEHGMAYRTRTWIEEILPTYGLPIADPALARDLLAAAALDAGGIRADVVGLAESHSREDIVNTGCAVLGALQNALASCESADQPSPRPSDPSCWPAAAC